MGASGTSTANYVVTFSSPPTLVAGQIYHLVVENTDSNPDANYFALDYAWSICSAGDRYHPRWANSDWGHGYWDGRWVNRPGYAPILDLDFAAGHYGMGYMEVSLDDYADISGASKMAREKITVSGGSRTISTVGVRVVRGSGTDPLVLTLQDAAGSAIATASIPAASIRVGSPSGGQGEEAVYATAPMSATLANGSTYYLRLSTASSSTYHAWAIRRGDSYGYHPATTFTDGAAQVTTNGSSWTSLGRVDGQNDLQFYFR